MHFVYNWPKKYQLMLTSSLLFFWGKNLKKREQKPGEKELRMTELDEKQPLWDCRNWEKRAVHRLFCSKTTMWWELLGKLSVNEQLLNSYGAGNQMGLLILPVCYTFQV